MSVDWVDGVEVVRGKCSKTQSVYGDVLSKGSKVRSTCRKARLNCDSGCKVPENLAYEIEKKAAKFLKNFKLRNVSLLKGLASAWSRVAQMNIRSAVFERRVEMVNRAETFESQAMMM